MLTTIGQSISDWNKGERPLKELSKDALFGFPREGDIEREWAFSKEMLARRAAFGALERRARAASREHEDCIRQLANCSAVITKAWDRVNSAVQAGDGAAEAGARQTVDNAKKIEAGAKERLLAAAASDAAMKAQLADPSKIDNAISAPEIEAYYAQRYGAAWENIVRRYNEASLFEAQSWGFASFLMCDAATRDKDMANYHEAESLAVLCGQTKSPAFQAISYLWQIRIAPLLGDRQRFRGEDGEFRVADLKDDLKKQYWAWWRTYNNFTRVYKWIDSSGIAYQEKNAA